MSNRYLSIRSGTLLAIMVATGLMAFFSGMVSPVGAAPTELFFSEYIEGSSYNKALEIYNGTGSAVDLAAGFYSIEIYFNGSVTAGTTIALTGTVADGDVYVVADDGAAAAILAETDQTSTSNFFNGDDAAVLLKDGVAIDVIGQIGTDPGDYWGSGDVTTQNHTLRRKATVEAGDSNGSDAFDPAVEWDGYAQDTIDGLGSHAIGGPDYTPIYDIQYTTAPSGDSPFMDQADVTTEGIVTARFQYGYFIEDPAGGAWNGLWVHDTFNSPALGDRVSLTGTVIEYNHLTELDSLTDYVVESSGNPLPAPEVLTTGDVSQEQWEGVLVRVENVTVVNDNLGYGEWSLSDGSGDVIIDDKGSYTYAPTNGDSLSAVIGPLDYAYGFFKIQPRDDNDIIIGAPGYTPIYDIQYTTDPSGDSPFMDQADVTTEGIVTAIFYNSYLIEDPAGGAWNGLWVYDTFNSPALGDRVRLTGTVSEYYNLTQLDSLTAYAVESSGNPVPAPEVLATNDVSQEQWEGVLVRVENVTVVNDNLGYGEWSVSDGSGDVIIDDKGSYTYSPVTGDSLSAVIGPLDYAYGSFKIQPRDDSDIILPTPAAFVINEVDADQVSTDSAEFVELYDGGIGNTDLTGLVLVLFNGSDDASYLSFDLDGLSTDADGYFVLCGDAANVANCDLDVSPDTNLIQNGADAVALLTGDAVDFPNDTPVTTDNLIDAIVYDTSDSDDAGLLVLLNPGQPQVNEGGGGDATAHSNQRCPNGEGGARNTDTYTQQPPTPGAANDCPTPIPDVIINEVDADQVSTDSAEFVELYDGGVGNTDLTGLVLVLFNGSDDASYLSFDLDGQTTDGDGYFVLCGDAGNVANCDLDVSPDTNLIQNGADAVALLTGDAVDFPNDTPVTTDNLIDAIVYDTDDGDDAGLLVLLNPGQPQVNERDGGDGTAHSNQRCPNGEGGARNTDTYTQKLPTPGAANDCLPPIPDVIINEVDADQVSTDSAEFVELYDGGTGNTDLTGLVLVLFNGSDDASYLAFDLDGLSTDGDGYFVLCGDAANVANCDLDVSPDTNLIQNGADAVALLTGDAADFPNDTPVTTDNLIDAIVYDTDDGDDAGLLVLLNAGQPQVNERGGGDGTAHSNQRCLNGEGGARNTDTFEQFAPTPGEENTCGFGQCGDPATFIHDVQGTGASSPMNGDSRVIIEGVVVGDFQDTSNQLKGFFLQEEDADIDADPLTSEGIFVYDNGFMDVSVGDVVRVRGDVTEYYELTELNHVSSMAVCPPGGATATAATVTLPVGSLDVWEQHEGMLINIPQTLYATGNYNQGRYGEVDLSVGGRLNTPTNVVAPGAPATALQELNDRSRIQLEDGSTVENPATAPYMGVGNTLRTGDTIPELTGVVSYGFGMYELHPTEPVGFDRVNTRDATPDSVGGVIEVASFNVLNYFTTIDTGAPICGPAGGMDCRGADSAAEFTRQRDKIISAIVAMDADVIGLMEMENHATDDALQDLVNGLNDAAGAGKYALIDTGPIGTDAIKVAFIYQPAAVTPVGSPAILDSSVDPLFIDTRNRPALAQTFRHSTDEVFTVVVNHLKSKGSPCDDIGDPDTGDGQGNCNLTRTSAAFALANWLAADPTGSGDPDFLIIGDLNAYAMEDPITAIKTAGYANLIDSLSGADAYSYQFYGQSGYLDHALSSPDLTPRVMGATQWHINADEPAALDYNDYNQSYLYTPDPFRSSDHDPVIVGICDGVPPEVEIQVTPDTLWPPKHQYVTVHATVEVVDVTGGTTLELLSVTSNEPDDGLGDGDTPDDMVIVDDYTFDLRAERSALGDGRIYTITYQATDACGNVTVATATVTVPRDRRPVKTGRQNQSLIALSGSGGYRVFLPIAVK